MTTTPSVTPTQSDPRPPPRPAPPIRDYNYKVTITKPGRLLYSIDISYGLCSSTPWSAWTLAGARRKAARIVRRQRRTETRRNTILASWTELSDG